MHRFGVMALAICLLSVSGLPAQEPVDFARDVFAMLKSKCISCHGAGEQEGQLRLDARSAALKGGASGKAIIPGNAKASPLWKRIAGVGDGDRMPLEKPPLSQPQIDLVRRWIDAGAKWPKGVGLKLQLQKKHWAYQSPRRRELPVVGDRKWPVNAIDYFVLAELQRRGMAPSPPAEHPRLLRRVYLDLIGIPPTLEQVRAFESDRSERAFEKVVDRLLASPRYGERWARAWLDLARYADSNGYQADQYRNVWPYRDWVIKAMNADMPFDQFTVEQLAGDLLDNANVSQKVATGFHRLTTCNVEAGVDPEQNRVNQVIDRVNATGTVWLGTTFECMQCHNHKYDPFSQRDYYRVFAYFNNTPMEVKGNGVTYNFVGPKLSLPFTAEQEKLRANFASRIEDLKTRLDRRSKRALAGLSEWERSLLAVTKDDAKWHLLSIQSFNSQGGASHKLLDDGSILVGGPNPGKDVYSIKAETDVSMITGFKLETLTDDSLPGKGPGRGSVARPNFVLHELTAKIAPQVDPTAVVEVDLTGAVADFSQKGWHVRGAVDGKANTGWAINPQFGKAHQASFLTDRPIGFEKGSLLTFSLDQHLGQSRTIGRLRLWAMTGTRRDAGVPAQIVKLLRVPADKRQPQARKQIEDYFLGRDPALGKLRAQLAALIKQRDGVQPITTLAMVESRPRETMIFRRGNFKDPLAKVNAGTPATLHSADNKLPANRLGFARWLVDPDNPLIGRVTVNRWWSEFFGHGLVATEEDFGTQGERPSHPALLDHLAMEFVKNGWSMKRMHKLIVMSATYRQSSRVSAQLLKLDAENRLLARGPRHRMSAEMIRDNALTVAGLLGTHMGGPPIYPPQPAGVWRHVGRNAPKYLTSTGENRFRRGIYVIWRRSAPYPSFTSFDAPDRASCVVKRGRTNTPLQALTLLNDPAYIEMARALAARIDRPEAGHSVPDKVVYAWRTVLSRRPTQQEVDTLVAVFADERKRLARTPSEAQKLLAGRGRERPGDPASRAAWLYIANILLNLDETITKG